MIRRQHIFLTLCMTSIILIIILVNNDEFVSIGEYLFLAITSLTSMTPYF